MSKQQNETVDEGQKLLSAVERLLASDKEILQLVANIRSVNQAQRDETESTYLHRLADKIITLYSVKSAVSGGATALPAIIPGAGTLVTMVGGALADAALVLKFEVEMALALSALYGYDITKPEERQTAFLLASISTYEAKSGESLLLDMAKAEGTAIWNYGPREGGKILLTVCSKLALLTMGKSFAKALPLVGVTIGAGLNKVLTGRVGQHCVKELEQRRNSAPVNGEEIIDATYEEA